EQELGRPVPDPAGRPVGFGESGTAVPVKIAAKHREGGGLVEVQTQPHIIEATIPAEHYLTRHPLPFAIPLQRCPPRAPRGGTAGRRGSAQGSGGGLRDGAAATDSRKEGRTSGAAPINPVRRGGPCGPDIGPAPQEWLRSGRQRRTVEQQRLDGPSG